MTGIDWHTPVLPWERTLVGRRIDKDWRGKEPLPSGTTESVMAKMYPEAGAWKQNPVGWVDERAGGYTWSKQQEMLNSVRDNRMTAVKACHGPGKSWTAAHLAAWWIDSHPPGSAFVIWTAPRWHQVQAVIGRELMGLHARCELPGHITLDCKWYIGKRLVGRGYKPADTDAHGFQGVHARFLLVIVDEACGIPKQLWDAIQALMTNDDCRLFAIGNPDDPASEFAKLCESKDFNVIKISAYDCPAFTGEYVPPKLVVMLVSKRWVEEAARRWGTKSLIFQAKVLAEFPDVGKDVLFPPSWIIKCHNNDLKGFAKGQYGLDVSRYGDDMTTLYRNRGGQIRKEETWSKQSTDETIDVVADILGIRGIPVVVDVIGLGSGVYDGLRKKKCNAYPFNASLKASDPELFFTLRDEGYWLLREAGERDEIDLDPEDLDLEAELGAIRYKIVNGKIKVLSKDDVKKKLGRSPDHSDAAMYSYIKGQEWQRLEDQLGAAKTKAEKDRRAGNRQTLTGGLREKAM